MKSYLFLLIFGLIFLFGCIQPPEEDYSAEDNASLDNAQEPEDDTPDINETLKCGAYELGETWNTYDGCNSCNCSCELINNNATSTCACTEINCSIGEEEQPEVEEEEEQPEEDSGNIIQGKTLTERLEIIYADLHTPGSGAEAKKYFPDLSAVFIDGGNYNPNFPASILPFVYYYSKEANLTVGICNIDYTIFICNGKIDHVLQESEYGNCTLADAYLHPEDY